MKKLLALPLVFALVACDTKSNQQATGPNALNTNLSFEQKRDLLVSYRGSMPVCMTDSGNCMAWTNLALHCERQAAGEATDYDKPCSAAENFRERVTGIELSTAPGAFDF
jgi:hypothetical protein